MIAPPNHWMQSQSNDFFRAWDHKLVPLRVLMSLSTTRDGRKWWHLSVSHRDRIPTWKELVKCRDEFLGDVETYHVIPRESEYVNVHPYCLHLWAPFDGKRCVANLQDLINEEDPWIPQRESKDGTGRGV